MSWVDLKRYEGQYKISRDGSLLSLYTGRTLKMGVAEGYPRYVLYKDGKSKTESVHRLLALQFIPNPSGLPIVNHLDGDKQNFALNNLEWTSFEGNVQHAFRTGLAKIWNKGRKSPHLIKPCEHCKETFTAKRKQQRFCSNKCATAADLAIELFKQGILK